MRRLFAMCAVSTTAMLVGAGAIDTAPENGLPLPNLKLDTDRSFELEYMAKGKVRPARPAGSYSLSTESVTLNFDGSCR